MSKTNIGWTNLTWNTVTGCSDTGKECWNCYARAQTKRFPTAFPNGFNVTLHPERLDMPLRTKKPSMFFVNSMSDLFHKDIPREFIDRNFDVMERADWHIYQVLTKRSSLMRDYINARYGARGAPPHMWLGVSVGIASAKSRIDHLRQTNAAIRFLSIEPLLEDVGRLDLTGIDWVIVGGESGPHARPMKPEWARNVRDQVVTRGIPFFFEQWGGKTPKAGGKVLDGREWCQWPARAAF